MSEYHMVGYSASVIKDGELFWHKNYGYAYLENSKPVSDSTVFMLSSISKVIVATAIMQLEEDSLINLNANTNNYLPEEFQITNPNFQDDSITIKMLLTHTSSLCDEWTNYDEMDCLGDHVLPLDSALAAYFVPGGACYSSDNFNNWKPGSTFSYSNIAFSLLGYIVECVTNESLEEYCQKNIFEPLEMNNTSWFFSNLDSSNIAMPYRWNAPYKEYGYYGFVFYPAIQLRTSSLQMTNFLLSVMNNGMFKEDTILQSETISRMLTREVYDSEYEDNFGLCWFETDDFDHYYSESYWGGDWLWGHTGSWGGSLNRYVLSSGRKMGNYQPVKYI